MNKHSPAGAICVRVVHSISRDASRLFDRLCCPLILILALAIACPAEAEDDLLELSLEKLLTVTVTSVSKKVQSLYEAAAAVHVISKEDIRRSGMTRIPELLRLVPGMHVARIDANKWAISSRGFNDKRANKMLVLMDGRTLYTPLFSGVYWDVQDTVLEDIERIEVILGPGSTLWGANAVNGVVNIITSNSADTQGGLVVARAGDMEKGGTIRYGGELGEDATLRAYAKYTDYAPNVRPDGSDNFDAWAIGQAGFRTDWEASSRDRLTFQGDIYRGNLDKETTVITSPNSGLTTLQDESDTRGANLMARWTRSLSEDAEWELQAYFDHTERREIDLGQRVDTFDLEFQHRFAATDSQGLTWGLGYRHIEDDIDNSFAISFDPSSLSQDLYSAFIQDEIALNEELTFTIGSKFEHNDYTGFEIQPSVRLLWRMDETQSLWGAVSRAVRTPSRSNRDIRINAAAVPILPRLPMLISIFGNDDFVSEEEVSFELGYRGRQSKNLTLDVAAFYNLYDRLYTSETGRPYLEGKPPGNLVMPICFDNLMKGETYGLELSANWQVTSDWRLVAGYSWLNVNMRLDPSSVDTTNITAREDTSPEHQMQLRSYWDIRHDLELDVAIYYSDGILVEGIDIPAYTRLDVRLGWHPTKTLELSLTGQNLLDDQHGEFSDDEASQYAEIPRSIYGQIKFEF